jgi:hypothetical protein
MPKSDTRAAQLFSIRALFAEETGQPAPETQYTWARPRKQWSNERYVPKMFDTFTAKYVRQCYIIAQLRPGNAQASWIAARNRLLPQFSGLFKILRESYTIDISAADLVDQILPTVAPEIVKLWQQDAEIINTNQNT